MIEKIKNEIRRFFDVRMEFILKKQQVNFDYNQISHLFKGEYFTPLFKWALSPSVILHILNDITFHKRKNIIEFGAGASTIYIAKLIKLYNLDTKFYSVESNAKWAETINQQLAFHQLEDYAKIILAPLIKVSENISYDTQQTWYNTDEIAKAIGKTNFDLIIVDGPAGVGSPYARYSAIPFLKDQIAADFSIFLDDTNRYDEKKIIELWREELKCEVQFNDRYIVFSNHEGFDVKPFPLV